MENSQVCKHEHTALEEQGELYISGGEVVNTLHTVVVCTDCMAEIDEPALADVEMDDLPF